MFGARPDRRDADAGPISAGGAAADGEYERCVPAVADSVGAIRRELDEFLTERRIPVDRRDDIAVCASELMTNVVMHAYRGRATGSLSVSADIADGNLVLTVADSGRGFWPRADSPGMGIGLALVAHFAGDLSIARTNPGTSVEARFEDVGSRGWRDRSEPLSRDGLLSGYVRALQRSLTKQEDTRALIGEARQAVRRHRQLQRDRPKR